MTSPNEPTKESPTTAKPSAGGTSPLNTLPVVKPDAAVNGPTGSPTATIDGTLEVRGSTGKTESENQHKPSGVGPIRSEDATEAVSIQTQATGETDPSLQTTESGHTDTMSAESARPEERDAVREASGTDAGEKTSASESPLESSSEPTSIDAPATEPVELPAAATAPPIADDQATVSSDDLPTDERGSSSGQLHAVSVTETKSTEQQEQTLPKEHEAAPSKPEPKPSSDKTTATWETGGKPSEGGAVATRAVQFAIFGKHPSHDDYYLFNDTGSDGQLAWFESSLARQMRDLHPGDAPGCHDRWLLWIEKGRTVVAAAWDSRDSRGRARTPLFACLAIEKRAEAVFVRNAVARLQALRSRLYQAEGLERDQFLALVRSEAAAVQELERLSAGDVESINTIQRANDVLRAVGLDDLSTAATLFPQAGLAAKLRRAGRMLRAFSVKPSTDVTVKERCLDQHCRVHQNDLDAAGSLDGWAALVGMTGQSGPLGIFISEAGVVDLFASKPESVNLSSLYSADHVSG